MGGQGSSSSVGAFGPNLGAVVRQPHGNVFKLLALTGMRIGEVQALTWDDPVLDFRPSVRAQGTALELATPGEAPRFPVWPCSTADRSSAVSLRSAARAGRLVVLAAQRQLAELATPAGKDSAASLRSVADGSGGRRARRRPCGARGDERRKTSSSKEFRRAWGSLANGKNRDTKGNYRPRTRAGLTPTRLQPEKSERDSSNTGAKIVAWPRRD